MPYRYVAKKLKNFVIYRILHVDDTPHRIAFGVAIGMFIALTPTVGFQMGLTVAAAALLRANKAVGVPLAWITNPVTIPPIYGFNYWLGTIILGGQYDLTQFKGFITAAIKEGSLLERLRDLWDAMWTIFWPLWLGSAAVGLLLAVISYVAVYYGVIRYRRFRHDHHPITTPAGNQPPAEARPDKPQDTPDR
jgi:hypothetical protein